MSKKLCGCVLDQLGSVDGASSEAIEELVAIVEMGGN